MPVCGGERGYLYTDLRPVQIKVHTIEARLVLLVLSLFLTVGTRSDLAMPGCGGRLSRWGGSQVAAGDMGSRSSAPGLEIPSWCRGGQGMVLLERTGFGGHPTPPKGCLCFSSLIFQWSSWFLPGMELLPGTELLWCPHTGCVASSLFWGVSCQAARSASPCSWPRSKGGLSRGWETHALAGCRLGGGSESL